eukprot:2520639-Alexandrium_andersonii.AAC.1
MLPPRVLPNRRGLGGPPARGPVSAAPTTCRVPLPVAEGRPVYDGARGHRFRGPRGHSTLYLRRGGYVGVPH